MNELEPARLISVVRLVTIVGVCFLCVLAPHPVFLSWMFRNAPTDDLIGLYQLLFVAQAANKNQVQRSNDRSDLRCRRDEKGAIESGGVPKLPIRTAFGTSIP